MSAIKKESNINNEVMSEIKSGRLRMRSKYYFMIASLLSISTIVISATMFSYLVSIVFLWFRIEMANSMARGARYNLAQLLESFPVWTIPISIILITSSVLMIKKVGGLYRYRTSYVALLLILVSLLIGLIVSDFDTRYNSGRNRGLNIRGYVIDDKNH